MNRAVPTQADLAKEHRTLPTHLSGATVSMRAMSAGDGYKYLLRTLAPADGDAVPDHARGLSPVNNLGGNYN